MKKYSKEAYEEFFEQFKNKALTPEELDIYVKTFTKYLNLNAEDVINSANKYPNIVSNKKTHVINKNSVYILAIITLAITALVIGGIIGFGLLASNASVEDVIMRILLGLFLWALLNTICYPLFRKFQNFYFHYKNSAKLKVGDICIWDPNGIYHSFDSETQIRSPRIVQITAISVDSIYVFCTSSGNRFRIPIDCANLLCKMNTKEENDYKLMIRYPLALPSFSIEEVKILEAAMILAKHTNERKLYDALGTVLEKVRFYNDHPYGDYNDVISSYKEYSKFMKETLGNMILPNSDDEENDI